MENWIPSDFTVNKQIFLSEISPLWRNLYHYTAHTLHFQDTTCACPLYWMIGLPSAAWRYWRLNDPFGSDAAATGAAKIANAFKCPANPQHCPFWGICTPSNTWFRGPTRVFIINGMSIGSAISPKMPLPLGGAGPPSNTWYLGPT